MRRGSNVELIEHKSRKMTDYQHDPAPKTGCVNDWTTAFCRLGDNLCDRLGLCPKQALLFERRRHRRIHKSGLDDYRPCATGGKLMRNALAEATQATFASAINEIRAPPAIASYRSDDEQHA